MVRTDTRTAMKIGTTTETAAAMDITINMSIQTSAPKIVQINTPKNIKYNYGARRARTADLLHAMQALSQLSYSPNKSNIHLPKVSPILLPMDRSFPCSATL